MGTPEQIDEALPAAQAVDGIVRLRGEWVCARLPLRDEQPSEMPVDTTGISRLDAFGATEIIRLHPNAMAAPASTLVPHHRRLMEIVAKERTAEPSSPRGHFFEGVGQQVAHASEEVLDLFAIQGRMIVSTMAALRPGHGVRLAAVANQFMETILRAIPIVCLISLVVGVILTQQSIMQLRNFGATVFVADLAGILMLREVGVLLAAIMVAGRSGAAMAAEIGAMRMREEIDALEVMGVDPYRAVVLPRAWALIAGMPALALLGAMAGILGAALVARSLGGVPFEVFAARLGAVVELETILIGVIKAPAMALAVVVIAVREGFRVTGSTESLGRHTTASVVKAIFAVILIDGLFAVYFGAVGI